jgi:hypothetical protein
MTYSEVKGEEEGSERVSEVNSSVQWIFYSKY